MNQRLFRPHFLIFSTAVLAFGQGLIPFAEACARGVAPQTLMAKAKAQFPIRLTSFTTPLRDQEKGPQAPHSAKTKHKGSHRKSVADKAGNGYEPWPAYQDCSVFAGYCAQKYDKGYPEHGVYEQMAYAEHSSKWVVLAVRTAKPRHDDILSTGGTRLHPGITDSKGHPIFHTAVMISDTEAVSASEGHHGPYDYANWRTLYPWQYIIRGTNIH